MASQTSKDTRDARELSSRLPEEKTDVGIAKNRLRDWKQYKKGEGNQPVPAICYEQVIADILVLEIEKAGNDIMDYRPSGKRLHDELVNRNYQVLLPEMADCHPSSQAQAYLQGK
jgi:hypothetical protein